MFPAASWYWPTIWPLLLMPEQDGERRVRIVDRGELAAAEHEAVGDACRILVVADDIPRGADPAGGGEGRPGDVERREVAPAENKAVGISQKRGVVAADDRSGIVDAPGKRTCHRWPFSMLPASGSSTWVNTPPLR